MEEGHCHAGTRTSATWKNLISLAALGLQCALLAERSGTGVPRLLWMAGAAALIYLGSAPCKGRFGGTFYRAIGTTLIGGLGMELGAWMDLPVGGSSMCGAYQSQFFFNHSTGLMLLFCFIGCRIASSHCHSVGFVQLRSDAICMISMIAGMVLGDILIAPIFSPTASDPVAMHWVMMIGMFFGNVGSVFVCSILRIGLPPVPVHGPARAPIVLTETTSPSS